MRAWVLGTRPRIEVRGMEGRALPLGRSDGVGELDFSGAVEVDLALDRAFWEDRGFRVSGSRPEPPGEQRWADVVLATARLALRPPSSDRREEWRPANGRGRGFRLLDRCRVVRLAGGPDCYFLLAADEWARLGGRDGDEEARWPVGQDGDEGERDGDEAGRSHGRRRDEDAALDHLVCDGAFFARRGIGEPPRPGDCNPPRAGEGSEQELLLHVGHAVAFLREPSRRWVPAGLVKAQAEAVARAAAEQALDRMRARIRDLAYDFGG